MSKESTEHGGTFEFSLPEFIPASPYLFIEETTKPGGQLLHLSGDLIPHNNKTLSPSPPLHIHPLLFIPSPHTLIPSSFASSSLSFLLHTQSQSQPPK